MSFPKYFLLYYYCTAPRYPDPIGPWIQAQQHGPHLQSLSTQPSQTTNPSFITWPLLGKTFPNNKERLMPKHTRECSAVPRKHHYRAFLLELEPSSKATFATFHPHLTTACSLSSAGDRSNIILGAPRSNHKKKGKFKDNIIK